jgi:hypothetical protein
MSKNIIFELMYHRHKLLDLINQRLNSRLNGNTPLVPIPFRRIQAAITDSIPLISISTLSPPIYVETYQMDSYLQVFRLKFLMHT